MLTRWFLLSACSALVGAQSDLGLTGTELQRFLDSKGTSLVGRDVHWHVPAKVFAEKSGRGSGAVRVFTHQGIALCVPTRSAELEEVRRRGGTVCVRGRVERIARPQPGEPACFVDVRQLRRRKK